MLWQSASPWEGSQDVETYVFHYVVRNCASALSRMEENWGSLLSLGQPERNMRELLLYPLNCLPNIAANSCAYVRNLNIFIESEPLGYGKMLFPNSPHTFAYYT